LKVAARRIYTCC